MTQTINNPKFELPTEQFVGWLYKADYEESHVLTNDAWLKSNPTPRNALLLAANQTSPDGNAILMRVTDFGEMPLADELLQTQLQQLQQRQSPCDKGDECDPLTQAQLQYGNITCNVLGTFFIRDGKIGFGADRPNCSAAVTLPVFRLAGDTLANLINFFPRRMRRTLDRLSYQVGHPIDLSPLTIGQLRYSATWMPNQAEAPVDIAPSDFFGTRTMVVGQTRSGKSNYNKLLISRLKPAFEKAGVPMSFLVLDANGEYGSDNVQDGASLARLFPTSTVQYSLLPRSGFLPLANNFFLQHREALQILRQVLRENKTDTQPDVAALLGACFEQPDPNDHERYERWQFRVAVFQTLLHRAGFVAPDNFRIIFSTNNQVSQQVDDAANKHLSDPSKGLSLDEAVEWCVAARQANRINTLLSSSGKPWLDSDTLAMLNLLASANGNGTFISGFRVLSPARKYHSPDRLQEVTDEIYQHLSAQRIVILDLSLGDPVVRTRLIDHLANEIFHTSLTRFTQGQFPPPISILAEECHNYLGKDMDLCAPWPRLAKEGAKLNIGLILSTQEPSSLHKDVLSNSENFVVFHLASEHERKVVGAYHDLSSFEGTNAPESGWARLKLLSYEFALPVQFDLFTSKSQSQGTPYPMGRWLQGKQ